MTCNRCGAATTVDESSGGTTSGEFVEVHECANGHRGRVRGDASDAPSDWTRTGAVFGEGL
jgi:hypothetical protein